MMRFSKGNGRRIFLSSLIWCVLWATLFIALKWDTYWYNSCFCICLGVFTATKEEEILGIIKNHYLPALTISALVFLVNVFCSLFIAKNEFTKFLFSGLGSIFFVITVLILLMKVRIRNKMWSFLSEISLEVYLIHPLYMKLLRNDYLSISNNIIWGLAVIALTVPTAYWLHLLLSKVASLVRKLR